jgi:hypothetical protein
VIKPVKKNTNKQQKTIIQQTVNVQLDIALSTIMKDTILFTLFLQYTFVHVLIHFISFDLSTESQISTN